MTTAKFKTIITKDEINQLPIYKFDGKITVITKLDDVLKAIKHLKKESILGFDTETKPSFNKGVQHSVCLLQLSSATETFLFRLNYLGLPEELTKILESPTIIKVGVAIQDDIKALQKLTPFKQDGFCDLANLAKKLKIKNLGLRSLAAILLHTRISKASKLSNWENQKLTDAQITYAAIDSHISRELYIHIEKNNLLGAN